jgi:hypothetical protein
MTERAFLGLNRTATEFRAWVLSDLQSPTTRALVAEYAVRCAVEGEPGPIMDWDAADIRTPRGSIEVKSTSMPKNRTAIFEIERKKNGWDATNNAWFELDPTRRHADIYVLCLHMELNAAVADSLDMRQWRFFVVRSSVLDREFGLAAKTVNVNRISRLVPPIIYGELGAAVAACFAEIQGQAL